MTATQGSGERKPRMGFPLRHKGNRRLATNGTNVTNKLRENDNGLATDEHRLTQMVSLKRRGFPTKTQRTQKIPLERNGCLATDEHGLTQMISLKRNMFIAKTRRAWRIPLERNEGGHYFSLTIWL